MKNREKILVGLAGAAVLWAAFSYLYHYLQPAIPETTTTTDIKQFIATVIDSVNRDTSGGVNEYVMKRAGGNWEGEPFLNVTAPETFPDTELKYQGYVKTGNRAYAIINGNEYSAGDTIEALQAVIKHITPLTVVLIEKHNRKIILPLEGEF